MQCRAVTEQRSNQKPAVIDGPVGRRSSSDAPIAIIQAKPHFLRSVILRDTTAQRAAPARL